MLFNLRKYLILTIFISIFLFRYICIGDDEIRIDNIGIISFLDDENIVKVEELYSSDIEITNMIVTSDRGVLICEHLNMVKEDDKSSMINMYGIKVKQFNDKWSKEWEVVIGKSVQNICKIVKEDSEHNYIIAGLSSDSVNWQSKRNIQVACIDKTGKLKWVKKYGKKDREITYDIGGLEIVNKKYIFIGTEKNRIVYRRNGFLTIVNEDGSIYYEKIINLNDEIGIKILASGSSDNRILLTGWSINKVIIYLLNFNIVNNSLNCEYYIINGNEGSIYRSNLFYLDSNTNKLVGGYTYGNSSIYKPFLMKIDNNSKVNWFLEFESKFTNCRPKGIVEVRNGEYLMYGNCSTKDIKYNNSVFIIKISNDGKVNFMKIFKLDNKWLEIKKIEINKEGELIGLFRKRNKGEVRSFIGRIEIK